MKHYKPTRYKAHKKPINKMPLFILAAGLLMLLLSIALGAYLGTLATNVAEEESGDGAQTPTDPYKVYDAYERLDAPTGRYVALDGYAYESDEDAERAILRANGSLVHALCINLLDSDGAPSYKSEFYSKTYSAKSGEIDIALLLSRFKKNEIAVTAYLDVYSLREQYREHSAERTSLELGIIKETYAAGLRDLIISTGEGTDIDLLYSYVCKIKQACPEMVVGFSVSSSVVLSDSIYTAKLDDVFDYIAIDLSENLRTAIELSAPSVDTEAGTDASAETGETGSADIQPDYDAWTEAASEKLSSAAGASTTIAERYGARLLIRCGWDCKLCKGTIEKALEALGTSNYTIVGYNCEHTVSAK